MTNADPVDIDWRAHDRQQELDDDLAEARATLRDKLAAKLKAEVVKAFAEGANAVLSAPRHGGTTDVAAVISDFLGYIPEMAERNTRLVSIVGRACSVPGQLGEDAKAFVEDLATDHADWHAEPLLTIGGVA